MNLLNKTIFKSLLVAGGLGCAVAMSTLSGCSSCDREVTPCDSDSITHGGGIFTL